MIRAATEADIPFVMELGRRFADDAGVTEDIGWDDESVSDLLHILIAEHVLLVSDTGMIGGLVFPHPFNRARIVFQELFWRSEGFEGVKLLKAAEDAARAKGASRSLMLTVATMPGAERIYERRGYRPAERTFIKEL